MVPIILRKESEAACGFALCDRGPPGRVRGESREFVFVGVPGLSLLLISYGPLAMLLAKASELLESFLSLDGDQMGQKLSFTTSERMRQC